MKKNKWIILLFIFALSFFVLSFFHIDPDYLWHIKAGEYMVHHGLLTKDVFSWSVTNKYWMSHEWLFEVMIYGLKQVFGNLHVYVYCFTCFFSLLLIIYFANQKQLTKNIIFTLIWFICSMMICLELQCRPHILSNCLLALTTWFLYDLYQKEDSKKIYFLPLISILWANIHGGSSNLPYLLCFLFIIAGSFRFSFSKIEARRLTKKQYFKFIGVMLLCMICVCINLHGFKMFLYPYQNMLDTTMIHNISEWRSTSLHEPIHYVYFALLLLIICAFLFSKKKLQFMDFILLGFCAYLGLKSIRFWFYTYIIMSFVIFDYIPKRKEDRGTSLGIIIVSILSLLFSFIRGFSVSYYFQLEKEDIQKIQEENPQRLFNMYNYGGDLIYNDIPVFVDGRADLYGKYNYKDYLALSNLNGDFTALLLYYHFDYLLVDKKYPIAYYLKYNDDYELIYGRENVLLYKKKN
ncbi:MAG: hypothetical protein IKF71_05550 [Bacilli bacterium]|nr:hypothetical protein [Bacilli bacterium]